MEVKHSNQAWWRTLVTTGAAILATALAHGQSASAGSIESAKPSGRAILNRYIEASGGETAIRQQTTRLSKGAFQSPNLPAIGSIEILQAAPKRSLQKIGINEGFVLTLGADGTNAWINVPGMGAQDFEGLQRDQFISDSDIFRILTLPERYTNLVAQPSARVGGVECDVVLATTRSGQKEQLYFAQADGLLRRWNRNGADSAGQATAIETYLDDYRSVDGLKLPFKISQPIPADQAFTLVLTEIKHGVEAPDSTFRRPTN